MTDDEIVAAVERRLGEVEGRLPPAPVAPERTDRPRLIPRHGPAVVTALAAAVVVVAAQLLPERPGGTGSAPTDPPSTPSAPSPSSPAAPPPSASPDLVVLTGSFDGDHLIAEWLGWLGEGSCFTGADISRRSFDLSPVDEAAERLEIESGPIEVAGFRPMVLADTAEDAARGFGSPVFAKGWILVDDVIFNMGRWTTPAGRTVWDLWNSHARVACPPRLAVLAAEPSASEAIRAFLGLNQVGSCAMIGHVLITRPDVQAADAAAEDGSAPTDPMVLTDGSVLAPTPAEAAELLMAAAVVTDGEETWVAISGVATQLVPFATPAGRTLWVETTTIRPCARSGEPN